MKRCYDPIDIARQFRFVRETLGPNRGVFVESIQRIGESIPGEPWCMSFASMVLWICYQGPAPLPRTASCAVALKVAQDMGWVTTFPAIGDVFFRVDSDGHAHHVGFVTGVYPDRVGTIAGNTSEDGMSREGTGVYEHPVARVPSLVFVHLPVAMP